MCVWKQKNTLISSKMTKLFRQTPSRSTADAALAAFLPVVSDRVFDCVSALPAAVFEGFPVDFEASVFAAAFAAFGLVCLDFAIASSPSHVLLR